MSDSSAKEDESAVQLILVEILTRSEEPDSNDEDNNIAKSYEEDFRRVKEYLLTNANSNIIVKLACQTLEKV
jgi:hypothetical protein